MSGRPPRPRITARLLLARLGLMVGGVALLVGGAELATRWLAPTMPSLMNPSPGNCLRRSDSLSVDFRPDCLGVLSGTSFRTNAEGLRGPPLREDGAPRILALGDSCTWGWRVSEDESYPGLLQQLVDARPDAASWEVLNAGVPGYTSYQGLRALEEKGLALHPAVVIAAFGWNDASTRGDIRAQIEMENRRRRLIAFDDWLLDHSHFYGWARARLADRAAATPMEERVPPMTSWENLDRIAALATAQDARVVFLNFLRPNTHPNRQRMLTVLSERWDAPVMTYEGPRLDLVHPTVEGYRDLAAQIVAALESRGALARGR